MKRVIRNSIKAANDPMLALSPSEYQAALINNIEDNLRRVANSISKAQGFLSGAFNQIQDDSLRDILTKLNDVSEHLTRAYDISITTLRSL